MGFRRKPKVDRLEEARQEIFSTMELLIDTFSARMDSDNPPDEDERRAMLAILDAAGL